jgi:hypothetical protein
VRLAPTGFNKQAATNMSVSWTATSVSTQLQHQHLHGVVGGGGGGGVAVAVSGVMDCTGYIDYTITITPPAATTAKTMSVSVLLPSSPVRVTLA